MSQAVARSADNRRVVTWDRAARLEMRIATVLAAALILYLRMPQNFSDPQFWAEDGAVLFMFAHGLGLKFVFWPVAGYYFVWPTLVASALSSADPSWTPTLYNCIAAGVALFCVYLATSPRFDMPAKPLLALAIVTVPAGWEVLGVLVSSMWLLPIGSFILLFCHPGSRLVLAGEAAFVALQATTGPFAIFLAPAYAARFWMVEDDPAQRNRMLLLTGIMAAGFVLQCLSMFLARDSGALGLVGNADYSRLLWITWPVTQLLRSFGLQNSHALTGWLGVGVAIAVLFAMLFVAASKTYRPQKLAMLYIGGVIVLAGLVKYRHFGISAEFGIGDRYFYCASVFFLWFIVCAAPAGVARYAAAAIVLVAEIVSVVLMANTPRPRVDVEWPVWARHMKSGLPVYNVPLAPAGWSIWMPASPTGPLSKYASWPGRTLSELNQKRVTTCDGAFDGANGWVRDPNPVHVVALVDASDRVVGFGFPGFRNDRWHGAMNRLADRPTKAYAVSDRGVCALAAAPP